MMQVKATTIVILVAVVSLLMSSIAITFPWQKKGAASPVKEIHGVKIESSPAQSRLDELGVSTWHTWQGGPSKFPWNFKSTETMYLLEGKVKVHVVETQAQDDAGHGDETGEEDEWFEIRGGDLVVFPKGMNIVWDVVESVRKHYHLADDSDKDDSD